MANVRSMFVSAINEGMKAAKMVQDPAAKANAYAAIASALAETGLINISADGEFEEGTAAAPSTPASTPAKGKDALKAGAGKAKAQKDPEPKPEPEAPAEAPEPELTEEWTEDMISLKADQIAYLQWLRESYEEAQLNATVEQFSEGTMSTLDDISPLNIDAFVAFVQTLLESGE